MNEVTFRESRRDDASEIERLYSAAFPDEDLVPLLRQLLDFGPEVLSLVAQTASAIAGHICFSICQFEGKGDKTALLGPLAVAPDLHKRGIGSRLVREGFKRLDKTGTTFVLVLGDPAYYGRFGFKAEDKVVPPYPLPPEWNGAWQSIELGEGTARREGKLIVPEPWRRIELWVP